MLTRLQSPKSYFILFYLKLLFVQLSPITHSSWLQIYFTVQKIQIHHPKQSFTKGIDIFKCATNIKSSFQRRILKNIFGKSIISGANISFPRCLLSRSLHSDLQSLLIYLIKQPFHCFESIENAEPREKAEIQIVSFFYLIIDENLIHRQKQAKSVHYKNERRFQVKLTIGNKANVMFHQILGFSAKGFHYTQGMKYFINHHIC